MTRDKEVLEFDFNLAVECGIEAAIIYEHLLADFDPYAPVEKTRIGNDEYVPESLGFFCRWFKYMSKVDIQEAILTLKEKNYIKTIGEFNGNEDEYVFFARGERNN